MLVAACALAGPAVARAAVFTVNTNDDVDDGVCNVLHCSLREAVNAANQLAGGDTIEFVIGGGGLQTIRVTRPLPTVLQTTTFDGRTQPGYVAGGSPLIEIDGFDAGTDANGFSFDAASGSSAVIALTINRFARRAILFDGGGGNVVQGSYLGTDSTGTQGLPGMGDAAIEARAGSDRNMIGGTRVGDPNVISSRIVVRGPASELNVIDSNRIGVNKDGTAGTGPLVYGVEIAGAAEAIIERNTIGGAGIGIVISDQGAGGAIVRENRVGTNGAGTAAIPNATGIQIANATNALIGGNLVSGNTGRGVLVVSAPFARIEDNRIGTNLDRTSALGNDIGVFVNASNDVLVGGNTISGNAKEAVFIASSDRVKLSANVIGTNGAGTAAISNGNGVYAQFSSGLVLGGPTVAEGNLISGNGVQSTGSAGFKLFGAASNVTITHNRIGVNESASGVIKNFGAGVLLINVTGGLIADNVISGSDDGVSGSAIEALGPAMAGITIYGNKLGTDGTGLVSLGNTGWGVSIQGNDHLIGGTSAGQPNVIGGNQRDGIIIGGSNIAVRANYIGTNTRFGSVPNGMYGVDLSTDASNVAVESNLIAHNTLGGIVTIANAGTGNLFQRNAIRDNGGLGIDLAGDGITANDAGDADSGPNNLQNFPVVTSAVSGVVAGTLLGTEIRMPYMIDVYVNDACDPSGNGEGWVFAGSLPVTTDAAGDAGFTIQDASITDGKFITATATGPGGTSEFSQCFQVRSSTITGASIDLIAPATSEPGATKTPIANVPVDAITANDGDGTEAAPLAGIPLAGIPLAGIPLAGIPLAGIPLAGIGLTPEALLTNGLGGVPLSSIPLLQPPGGWPVVLTPTPLGGVPIDTLTLADVVEHAPGVLSAIDLGDVSLAHSPLAGIPLAGIPLAGIPLAGIPIGDSADPLVDWCAALNATPGFSCSSPSSLSGQTMIGLSLQGFPLAGIDLDSVPLAGIDWAATPLAGIPLAGIDLAGTTIGSLPLAGIDWAISPLAGIPLSALPVPGDVVACDPAPCAHATLGDAVTAAVLAAGATIADIGAYPGLTLADLLIGLPPTVTLHDLLELLMPPSAAYDWEELPLDDFPLQDFRTEGGEVQYRVSLSLEGTGNATPTTVRVKLPDDGRYVEKSSVLFGFFDGSVPQPGPPTLVGDTLEWTDVRLIPGLDYELRFRVRPGLSLGPSLAKATLEPPTIAPVEAVRPLGVVEAYEPNTAKEAVAATPDALYTSHISHGRDVDYYSITVPPNATLTAHLSHLTYDADLVVFGPRQPLLVAAPLAGIPLADQPLPDAPVQLEQRSQSLSPEPLPDLPLSDVTNLEVVGVSDNRLEEDEEALVGAGPTGSTFLIQVSGYDGAHGADPYMLRLEVEEAAPLPPCPQPRSFDFAGQGTAGTIPASYPAGRKTLILVNQKRLGDTYGAAGASSVMSALGTLAARPEVAGAIVPVEGNAAVAAAYAAWDAQPCDVLLANALVSAITALEGQIRASQPGIEHVMIVGGDDQIPFGRLADNTVFANERDFSASLAVAPGNSQLRSLYHYGYLPSDDPYGDKDPVPFFGGQLFSPDLGLGRLVETPAEITAQVSQYILAGGMIDPSTELTTGYEFLTDGAQGIAAANTANFGAGSDLINDTWTGANLLARLFPLSNVPLVNSVNAHYDHYRLLPADQSVAGLMEELVTTGHINDRGPEATKGRLIFTMGCHSGVPVPDVLYGAVPFATDWAQTFMRQLAVGYMGNTGYGLGDTVAVAYSERLNVLFAGLLDGSVTIGRALSFAKHAYLGDTGIIGLYDAKVTTEATYFGIPTYRIGPTIAPPAPPAPLPTSTDPATGLEAATFNVSPTFDLVNGTTGKYYEIAGKAQVTARRPIQPLAQRDVTQPDAVAHGALLKVLVSTEESGFNAAYSRPIFDSAASEPELVGETVFPTRLQSIRTFETPTGRRQRLNLIAGQFRSDDSIDVEGIGIQRRFTNLRGSIFYSTSADWRLPSLGQVEASRVGSLVGFALDVIDLDQNAQPGTVKQVYALYLDASGTWRSIDLQKTGNRWSGAGPVSGTTIEWFIQAVDAAGNVAVTHNKGEPAPIVTAPTTGNIAATLAGTLHASGYYTSAVTVAITAGEGVTIERSVDGEPFVGYTAPFEVTGSGVHTIEFRGSDGSHGTAIAPIDVTAPTIAFGDEPVVFINGTARASFLCRDAGSGIASCTASPDPLDTSTVGTHEVTVIATDRVGNRATASSTYEVHWVFSGFFAPVNNLPTLNIVQAGRAVPVKFGLGGNRGLDIFADGYPRSQQIPCDSNASVDGIEETTTAGESSLSYDPATQRYHYTWTTEKAWAGTCRQLILKLADNTVHRANFKFN